MRPRTLDHKIMTKLAKKLGKPSTADIYRLVYARASRQGISSEAALIQLAREHGIGTATYQGKLDPTKQAEARTNLPFLLGSGIHRGGASTKPQGKKNALSAKAMYKATIASLIQDDELRERCADLLVAKKHFDRAINQATLVLEDRIRHKAQPLKDLVGESLVGSSFNEELAKTVLQVSSGNSDDQRGFTQILRGIVPTFRNKTHHHVTASFSREDAMRVCGFIDVLLRIVDSSQKVR
jgi:uncharacterized protein (TIGR02391 family)